MPTPTLDDTWPSLPYEAWADTCRTLQLWTQIVGKVRLAQTPWLNHSWQAPLYLTARGLGTGVMSCGARALDLEFDFVEQTLEIRTDTARAAIPLEPGCVADFHAGVLETLARLGAPVRIHGAPNELPDAIPFVQDTQPRAYDGAYAERFWRVLLQADRVMKAFRTGFLGKASPVHFFWGSFDLAATRFSARRAPPHPGGVPHLPDSVAREAYSHEVSSAGFWPGGPGFEQPAFYAYAYPEPPGFRDTPIGVEGARFDTALGEFILPYESIRRAADPEAALLAFLSQTYAAAADAGGWDRALLECPCGEPRRPRPV